MLREYIKNPYRIFMLLGDRGLLDWLPDEPAVKLLYRANIGKKLDLNNPQTFCEKLNWLKLYDRRPEYTQWADKLGVRDYVASKIGKDYLVPLLGVWDDPDDIDFDILPERFVLKATHDSGSIVVCREKARLDTTATKAYFKRALKSRYYLKGRERQYEGVVPRVIAEEFLDSGTDALPTDYKIYCFGGQPKCLYLGTDRGTDREFKMTVYDTDWNRLPVNCQGTPTDERDIPRPESFPEILRCAAILAGDTPLMRVDFYEVQGRVYFGEMTLCDGSGFMLYEPPEWERRLGEWIPLPEAGWRARAARKRRR